ncbi:MAG: globin [Actinomycetota bacterium]|nr:globin [Actinomycetota bacterium]
MATPRTLYERVGGEAFFETLTRRFYDAVADDAVLAAVYPTDAVAFEEARIHLRDFLIQYFGGPTTYSEQRGAPRLRMRHQPFVIGSAERDAWVRHMSNAVRESAARGLDESRMLTYFDAAGTATINQPARPDHPVANEPGPGEPRQDGV